MISFLLRTLLPAAGLAVTAVLFGSWSYRRASPQPTAAVRRALVASRSAALAIAGFVLLSPVLEYSRPAGRKPAFALMVDDSRSMAEAEKGGTGRSGTAARLAAGPGFRSLSGGGRLSVVLFSDRVRFFGPDGVDSSKARGPATDLAAAFRALVALPVEDRPAAVILVSDGAVNLGGDPVRAAEDLGVPVHTLCVGDSNPAPDVRIVRALSGRTVTAESDCPVEVSVSGRGFGGRSVAVSLFAGDTKADGKTVDLPPEGREADVRLSWRPMVPGDWTLRAAVTRFPGEWSAGNNDRRWTVQVLKRRLRVLVLAGGPGPDLSFIRRGLESAGDFQVETRIWKSGSEFYEGRAFSESELSGADVVFLVNVPAPGFPGPVWRNAVSAIRSSRLPFAWFPGKAADTDALGALGDRLPFTALVRGVSRTVTCRLTAEGDNHPAVRLREGADANRRAWLSLPPVSAVVRRLDLKPWAASVVDGVPAENPAVEPAGGLPLIVAGRSAEGKCLAVLAEGIYRWELVSAGLGSADAVLAPFLENAVRWLVRGDDGRPVRFIDETGSADAGRDFPVAVWVTDAASRPVSGGRVDVTIEGPSGRGTQTLEETDTRIYRGSVRPAEPGPHRIAAEARLDGALLGRDTMFVSVQPFLPELIDSRSRPELLRSISETTGGMILNPGDPDPLSGLPLPVAERMMTPVRIGLYDMPWLLIPLAMLLVFEWILRRRAGME
jgi:hypothetical protein